MGDGGEIGMGGEVWLGKQEKVILTKTKGR